MVVVFHHIGKPRSKTMSQNERITRLRLLVSDGFSGGGSFRVDEIPAASATPDSPPVTSSSFGAEACAAGPAELAACEVGIREPMAAYVEAVDGFRVHRFQETPGQQRV